MSWTIRIALLAWILATTIAAPAAAAQWHEIRTDHFTLVGNGPEPELRSVALELERFRVVVQSSPGMRNTDPIVPVIVFAVRGVREFRQLSPDSKSDDLAGWFRNVGLQVQIVIRLDANDSIHTAYHEYHHLLVNRGVPSMPVWLGEGLAEIWAGVRVEGNRIDVGHPDEIAHYLATLRRTGRLPLDELVTVDHESKHYVGAHKGRFYAQSTLLAHMLLFEEPEGDKRLQQFIAALDRGVAAGAALEETWGPVAELEEKFDAYVQRKAFSHRISTLSGSLSAATTTIRRELSRGEVQGYRGQFLAYGRDHDGAVPDLIEALVDDPNNVIAATGLAAIAPEEQALELLDRATRHPSASFDAFWLSAVRRTSPGAYAAFLKAAVGKGMLVSTEARRGEVTERIERDLEKAIALAPRFAPAYIRLAIARAPRDLPGARELVNKAIALEPGKPVYVVRAAKLAALAGDKLEAQRLAAEATRLAIAIPRVRVADDVCRYGVYAGLGAEVLPACDSVIERQPTSAARLARFYGRAGAGDLTGAAEDLREFLVTVKDKDDREGGLAWVRALEAGRNPVDAESLRRLEELEDSVVGLSVE